MSRKSRLIGEYIDEYKLLVEDYNKLLARILKDRPHKSKPIAVEIEKEARALSIRYDDFGHEGLEAVFREIREEITRPSSYGKPEATRLFLELDYSGLMLGGKYWRDWLRWYRVKSDIFQPDEKKNGPAAYSFTLDGIVEDLQDWRSYFANAVLSWWAPANDDRESQYWHAGELFEYTDHKVVAVYQDKETFRDQFKDPATYAKFREHIYRPGRGNGLQFRTGAEYAAITCFLVNSDKVSNPLHDFEGCRTRLCRAFSLPDYSSYHQNNNEVKKACEYLKGEFRFLL